VGKLSVNVVLPKGGGGAVAAEEVVAALRALLPAVAHVRVTIPVLNATDLYPKKDYEANRLRAAPLQLPAGCMLVADETGMSDGHLLERGVKNIRALTSATTKAVVPVDFQYYESELLFDANAVLVSAGAKSLVSADVIVRTLPDADTAELGGDWRSLAPDELRRLRLAVALLADEGPFVIPKDVATAVEDTFVTARRDGSLSGTDGQEVLSRWLAVARASARSHGETSLSLERWNAAVQMERARETRNAFAMSETSRGGRGAALAAGRAALPPRAPTFPVRPVPQ
jgi:hypothetical protein